MRVLIGTDPNGYYHAYEVSTDARLQQVLKTVVTEAVETGRLDAAQGQQVVENGDIGALIKACNEGSFSFGPGGLQVVDVQVSWKKGVID